MQPDFGRGSIIALRDKEAPTGAARGGKQFRFKDTHFRTRNGGCDADL